MRRSWLVLLALAVAIIVFIECFGVRLLLPIDEGNMLVTEARFDLRAIAVALVQFHKTQHRYPATDEIPGALIVPGKAVPGVAILDRWPKDSWGHNYIYKPTPDAAHPFALYSSGPNGLDEHGAGDDIDYWTSPNIDK